ncbi:hypothetical protein IMZ48_21675 [Candidatus Bathyarchaeota archaeon]|nr:hypothetical protein [Candidatus Bathyarchaeota archaeon]
MHPRKPCLAAFAAIARLCEAAGTMRIDWTTDLARNHDIPGKIFDLDGPWQAVAVIVGDDPNDEQYGVAVPLWPSNRDTTTIPRAEVGGGLYSRGL